MERKIGEIFEYEGEWYQCIPHTGCELCDFNKDDGCEMSGEDVYCSSNGRQDETPVIFKKLEKVGEPIKVNGKVIQTLKLHTSRCECEDCCFYRDKETGVCCKDSPCRPYEIFVEIKQTKEDMEDLDKIKVSDYTKVEELNVMEEKKLNLKPFDLEKAREGKPVCTRDGRKARIICFDRIDNTGLDLPIVALIQCEETEILQLYREDGKRNVKVDLALDLMMLPEKKERWVNVYKERCYTTKEEAIKNKYDGATYVDTVKIEWNE